MKGDKKRAPRISTTKDSKDKKPIKVYPFLENLSSAKSRRRIKRILQAVLLAGIALVISAVWQIEEFVVIPFADYLRILLTAMFGSALTVIGSVSFEMQF